MIFIINIIHIFCYKGNSKMAQKDYYRVFWAIRGPPGI